MGVEANHSSCATSWLCNSGISSLHLAAVSSSVKVMKQYPFCEALIEIVHVKCLAQCLVCS